MNTFKNVSGKRLLKYYSNFKKTGVLQRLMHYCNDEWNDFPQDVVTFVNEDVGMKPMVEVVVDGKKILLDFLHMMQLDLTNDLHQPIAWIDVSGKCFFPEIDETHDRHLHLEIQIHGLDNESSGESNAIVDASYEEPQAQRRGGPTSPWISFPMLLAAISGKIPVPNMMLVNNNYELFSNQTISREEFVEQLRLLVGDALLQSEIRSIHGNVRRHFTERTPVTRQRMRVASNYD